MMLSNFNMFRYKQLSPYYNSALWKYNTDKGLSPITITELPP